MSNQIYRRAGFSNPAQKKYEDLRSEHHRHLRSLSFSTRSLIHTSRSLIPCCRVMTAVLPLSHSFHHDVRMQQAVIILFEKLFSPRPRMPAGGGFFNEATGIQILYPGGIGW
jgi:hypothetical protein